MTRDALPRNGEMENAFLLTGREWSVLGSRNIDGQAERPRARERTSQWLAELKLYDFRNRMYQPELGRFIQPDPKEFDAGDYNLYRYCHNDPVNKSDPFGLLSPFEEAAQTIARINPESIKGNKEKLFVTYKDPGTGKSKQTTPRTTTETGGIAKVEVPHKAEPQLINHTHGDYSNYDSKGNIVRTDKAHDTKSDHFSTDDITTFKQYKAKYSGFLGGVLGTPSGKILMYDVITGNITEYKPK